MKHMYIRIHNIIYYNITSTHAYNYVCIYIYIYI